MPYSQPGELERREARVKKHARYRNVIGWLGLRRIDRDPADICPKCDKATFNPDTDEMGGRCGNRKECGCDVDMIGLVMVSRKRGRLDALEFLEQRLGL